MRRLLQHWITDQAMHRPDALAVAKEEKSVNYAGLEKLSNQIAHVLRECGCKRGDRVGFLMPKTPEAIISVIGILKADCIYVPLDLDSPVQRLTKIIKKCQPRVILTFGDVQDKLADLFSEDFKHSDIFIGTLDTGDSLGNRMNPVFSLDDIRNASEGLPDYKNTSEDTAHILFTSGSTGEPKGVVTSHANVISFIRWAKTYFGIQSTDRLSNHPPLHFDMSSLDIYGAFSAGAQLHLVPSEYNLIPNKISDFIRDREITQWFSVPSVLNYMSKFDAVRQNDFPSLKRLIWCGEVFPTPALRYWMKRLPDVSFTNLYGPTETTVASTYYTVPKIPDSNDAEIPIGKPCAGESIYILDKQLNPVPDGEVGDLYISGVGVSKGYWKDEKKTNEVFRFNPYAIDGDRIFYKTGDLARFGEDGLCYFHGRVDNQIKSRGYRIELGEIENAVNSLQLTIECAVVSYPTEGFEGHTICCAYVPLENNGVNAATLENQLSELLPGYMIPHNWESYSVLPKNKNGKVDRSEIKKRFQNNEVTSNA